VSEPSSKKLAAAKTATGEDRRRSQRVMIRMPVTLRMTVDGKEVSYPAHTVSVNSHGAMLMCAHTVAAGARLEMRNDHTHESQTCRVTRTPTQSQQSFLIPVEFAASNADFWHISFPPDDWKPTDWT
jgi:hypothetical protein